MNRERPVLVLLDASVLRRGHFADGSLRIERMPWGRSELEVRIPGFRKRPDHQQEWLRQQVRCVPTIARLVRERVIEGYVSQEIQFEKGMGRFDEPVIGNVFWGVPLKTARVPVCRSRFIQGGWGEAFGKEGILYLCRTLRQMQTARARALSEMPELREHFHDFEKESLRSLGIFQSICKGLADAHLRDAYHLWTAERNGLDFFCIADRKFQNAIDTVRRHHGLPLKCKLVTPEELLDRVGVSELDSPPLQDGWFYDRWGFGEPVGMPRRPKVLERLKTYFGGRLR